MHETMTTTEDVAAENPPMDAAELYLDLLKKTLTRLVFDGQEGVLAPVKADNTWWQRWLLDKARKSLNEGDLYFGKPVTFDPVKRTDGSDWLPAAETMIGLLRLNNLQTCVTTAIKEGVPGDVIETGVWRGGATIFMRGILKAYGDTTRKVWVADSFEGLPKPNADQYPEDEGDTHWMHPELAISIDIVKQNFERYGLLDDQVQFLKGWFRDTLPTAPIKQLAVIRLDGDMYESTIQALDTLYPKLSPGGYLIVDDYGAVPGCKKAIHEFREQHGIDAPMRKIDWTGIYWRK